LANEPFNNLLGIRTIETGDKTVTIECQLRPELMNSDGVLHGGVTATLADVAVGQAVEHHFGGARLNTTVEMKVNYLRPIMGTRVTARGRLLRIGNTLCVGQADVMDDAGNLAGVALVTYMLLDAPAPVR
jgi:uncharacterized protein (TIGR00369 family)